MSHLFVSSSAEDRLEQALAWLRAAPPRRELLVVAANRGAADDLVRRAAAETGDLFAVHRATLLQLAHELAALPLAESRRKPLTSLSVHALATLAIYRARDAGALRFFAPVAAMPGFPVALARTLRELRLDDVADQRSAAQRAALEHGDDANQDLALLRRGFEEELERFRLADLADVLLLASRRAESGEHHLVGLPLLLLDVVARNRAEERLLAALATRAPECQAVMAAGDDRGLEAMERALRTTAVGAVAADAATGGSALARARRYLFSPEAPASAPAPSVVGSGQVELFSEPGEDRECVEIARRILEGAHRGVPFDQMAILLRQPDAYLPLLEDALRRAGIPAYHSRGTSRPDPAGRAFLALLGCAAEGLSASRFAEYLSLGEAPAPDASGAPPPVEEVPWVEPRSEEQLVFKSLMPAAAAAPDPGETLPVPAAWERLLVDAAVIGGRDRWRRRLQGLRRELELRRRRTAGEEDAERRWLDLQIGRLESLERFALPIVDMLADLPATARWGEWLDALERLAVRVLQDPLRVQQTIVELRPMADVGPVSLEQVRDVLRDRLAFLRREPPPRRYGRVFVGTVPEAQGSSFDTVFLPGLAEGMFPRKPFEDPLLLDADRRALELALDLQEDRFADERNLLRLALGAARRSLVASYPRLDQMLGRARVPSFYAFDLLRAARGDLPDLRALERAWSGTLPGWPAPADPAVAIDAAEYDLAVLAPLLRPGASGIRGKASYLVEVNEHLARSLRARGRRWRPKWHPVDGLVEPAASTLERLREELPGARSYSPTALQTFAACPYRFLLHAIHRLRPREDRTSPEQLDPLTRGSLFHETQFAFFAEAKERGLLPLHPDFEAALLDLADAALDGVAARYEDDLAPAIPRIWKSEIEGLRTDLRGWIRKLLEADNGYAPAHFEFAFGLALDEHRDPSSSKDEAIVLDGQRLRGSIDLVERDWRRRTLRVTDHKTGRAPYEKSVVIKGGELLQPVLYALAAEKLLAAADERVESGRLFYCTQRGGYLEIVVPLDEGSRDAAREVLAAVEESVRMGFLPAAPRDGACEYCDYRAVCGPYEERRVKRKKREPLARLEALRRRA